MSKVQELEAAVADLPREEFRDFARWFDAERNRIWDEQLEEDAQNGKLKKLFEKLQKENQGQPEIPLDEVLNDAKLS